MLERCSADEITDQDFAGWHAIYALVQTEGAAMRGHSQTGNDVAGAAEARGGEIEEASTNTPREAEDVVASEARSRSSKSEQPSR